MMSSSMCCGYSSEVPPRGTSDEYLNIYFRGEISKTIFLWGGGGLKKVPNLKHV